MLKRLTNYDLGIIGGMGSEASCELYSRILKRTKHSCDQEHMKICVLNNSIIPDRTECLLNSKDSPVPYINEAINDLEKINAKYFVIACNTAHSFINEFNYENIKFINMIDETLNYIRINYPNKKVCILGTNGTIKTGVYYKNSKANDIDFIKLDDINQQGIMNAIIDTKNDREKKEVLNSIVNILKRIDSCNKCLFVLACTELSLYKDELEKNFLIIDSMDCLVESAIIKCGYSLK